MAIVDKILFISALVTILGWFLELSNLWIASIFADYNKKSASKLFFHISNIGELFGSKGFDISVFILIVKILLVVAKYCGLVQW